jgi:hypothetical protein
MHATTQHAGAEQQGQQCLPCIPRVHCWLLQGSLCITQLSDVNKQARAAKLNLMAWGPCSNKCCLLWSKSQWCIRQLILFSESSALQQTASSVKTNKSGINIEHSTAQCAIQSVPDKQASKVYEAAHMGEQHKKGEKLLDYSSCV